MSLYIWNDSSKKITAIGNPKSFYHYLKSKWSEKENEPLQWLAYGNETWSFYGDIIHTDFVVRL